MSYFVFFHLNLIAREVHLVPFVLPEEKGCSQVSFLRGISWGMMFLRDTFPHQFRERFLFLPSGSLSLHQAPAPGRGTTMWQSCFQLTRCPRTRGVPTAACDRAVAALLSLAPTSGNLWKVRPRLVVVANGVVTWWISLIHHRTHSCHACLGFFFISMNLPWSSRWVAAVAGPWVTARTGAWAETARCQAGLRRCRWDPARLSPSQWLPTFPRLLRNRSFLSSVSFFNSSVLSLHFSPWDRFWLCPPARSREMPCPCWAAAVDGWSWIFPSSPVLFQIFLFTFAERYPLGPRH